MSEGGRDNDGKKTERGKKGRRRRILIKEEEGMRKRKDGKEGTTEDEEGRLVQHSADVRNISGSLFFLPVAGKRRLHNFFLFLSFLSINQTASFI
jgi:hypothetical protein